MLARARREAATTAAQAVTTAARRRALAGLLAATGALAPGRAGAAEPVLVEFHYTPVPDVQLAIWLEDRDGKHALDVLVTQATGKYGIGNRPGRWDFLSSWRAPYGPRPSVLPIWAHRTGQTYPRVIFFDEEPLDLESLGWHENSSTAENYFCIPLTPAEHETVVVDTMTCPSPKNFSTDKGRFDPEGGTSVYPPRNDLMVFDAMLDSQDAKQYAALNELDSVTAATPVGDREEFTAFLIPAEVVARGPLTARVEVSRERDQNESYTFDREDDHYVDPRLSTYGIEYLGQPSVLYEVRFDPNERGFTGTTRYSGYGDWDGATGTIHPRDATISEAGGSGGDRLRTMTKNGDTFRWGVFSYGEDGLDGGDSDGDGWQGSCELRELPAIEDLQAEVVDFDRVRLTFVVPRQDDPEFRPARLKIRHVTGEDVTWTPEVFDGAYEVPPIDPTTLPPLGQPTTVEVAQLWGDYTYQFAVLYEDSCTNRSPIATVAATTTAQKFQTVDSFCFVATAAFGAPWAAQVAALRAFRDAWLKPSATGADLVRFYYAHSPPLARVIAGEPLLRGLARVVLQPVADAARLATTAGGA
ncbi:CFI-box-CTERM domain-containing protein [Nannocystis pusilla]|uniref:CFI-box-CTERM domain-containing protein n=1 Tax=Nannocystis pusilla TaxID=889268 RepID=UPI003DA3881B